MGLPRWPRPYFQRTDSSARLSVVTFTAQRPKGPVEPGIGDGWPDDFAWPESVSLNVYDLTDPEQRTLFQHAFDGSIRDRAAETLGAAAARIDSARFAIHLDGDIGDPRDLAHLQAVQATLRWLARDCEAFAALNETSIEWIDVAGLANTSPSPRFQLAEWLRLVVETEADPRFGAVLHTRGMVQFGRPDLLMHGFDHDVVSAVAEAVDAAANALAKGGVLREGDPFFVARLKSSPSTLDRAEAIVNVLRPDENGPDVGLENDGLILRLDADVLRQLQLALDGP